MPIKAMEIAEARKKSEARLKNASREEIEKILRRVDPTFDLPAEKEPARTPGKKSKHASAR